MGLFTKNKTSNQNRIVSPHPEIDRALASALASNPNALVELARRTGGDVAGARELQQALLTGNMEPIFEQDALRGDPSAMHNMGVSAITRGDNVSAENWFRKAAAKGHVESMANLGVLEVKKGNELEARRYLEQAARNGSKMAKQNLALMNAYLGTN